MSARPSPRQPAIVVDARRLAALLLLLLAALAAGPARAANGTMPGVKHLALILANADYDGDGKIRAEPDDPHTPGFLRDLANPCRDAAMIRATLLAANWRPDEIAAPPCNLTAKQMRDAITDFRQKVADATNTVVVFYFSGHGAQFTSADTSHSFMFGVGARFDLAAIRGSLQHASGNTSFDATGAVDLHELTSTLGRQSENAVLIVLDACRNNPLFEEIGEKAGAPAISALSSNSEEYTGVVLAYSTPAGQFSGDGFGGHSIYTQALSSLLPTPGATLDDVLNSLEGKVAADYKAAYPLRTGRQEPITRGRFSGRWCIWACEPLPVAPPVAALDADTFQSGAPRAPARPMMVSLLVQQVPSPTPAPSPVATALPSSRRAAAHPANRTLFDLQATDPALALKAVDATRFDVFWCDGDAAAAANERRASEVGGLLRDEAARRAGSARSGALPRLEGSDGLILSVRVRRLSAGGNTSEGFRYTRDLVIYDVGSADEQRWAAWIAGRRAAFAPTAEPGNTPGYVSLVVCAAPRPALPRTSTVYLQVRMGDEKAAGARLLEGLTARVPHLTVPFPADVPGGIESRVGPPTTEVRFFYPEDRDNAFATAAALEAEMGHPISMQYMPRLAGPNVLPIVEIWIGPAETAFPILPHPIPAPASGS